ncbi:MAG: hypothetical protein IPL61_05655 [Myxococcales bacterium]|nr:hypothetical protein [Myxococcales bacterium]
MDDRFAAGRAAVTAAILEGTGATPRAEREAAYDGTPATPAAAALVATVRQHAYRVTDEHVAALRAEGKDDAAIFELTVAAAVGQATRQIDHALAVLAATTAEPS